MANFWSTPPGANPIEYMFVDAGSLRGYTANLSRRFFDNHKFAFDLSRITQHYTRVFYYDALPVRMRGEDEKAYLERTSEQRQILEAAASVDGVHVYEGDAHKRKNKGAGGFEQKKVDVMIAVDMLTHTFRHNMTKASLLTGDNDFKPLIDALVREGMFITLWFPPGETNKELVNAADARRPLDLQIIWNWMTDDSRKVFTIPAAAHFDPSVEDGELVKEWDVRGVRHMLRKSGDEFVVLRDHDALNRLNVRHSNYEFLKVRCLDFGIELPDAAF